MVFSDTVNNSGGVQQTRHLMRVDATQWPTQKIANSFNNYHDYVTGYMIGSDRRFQWDDTNHTKLPEGTAQLTVDVSDYAFLTDEQGNRILTLIGISILRDGKYYPLKEVDRDDPNYDPSTFGMVSGIPTQYDKIADNVIRLDCKPLATVASGMKFYFQRVGSRFSESDTTKEPGVSPLLHRGYVIAAAYDGAMALGLGNLQALLVERQLEDEKLRRHFSTRNKDEESRAFSAEYIDSM